MVCRGSTSSFFFSSFNIHSHHPSSQTRLQIDDDDDDNDGEDNNNYNSNNNNNDTVTECILSDKTVVTKPTSLADYINYRSHGVPMSKIRKVSVNKRK